MFVLSKMLIVIVTVLAAVWDLKTYRIPNWLTFSAMLLGFVISAFGAGAPGGIRDALIGFGVGFAVMLPFFLFGVMGGGDVKLAAAFGALGGLQFVINALLMGALLGGAFALVYLVWQKGLRDAFKKVFCDMLALFVFGVGPESEMEMVMPYGVFVSLGAFLALFCEVIRIAA